MKKKKLNVQKLCIFVGAVVVILIVIIFGIKTMVSNYKTKQTYEYKLGVVGYNENEVKTIKEKLTEEQIDKILTKDYMEDLCDYLNIKYFNFDKLDEYKEYKNNNESVELNEVIAIVNVGANKEWYSDIKETDSQENELMLVNKFYKLPDDFEPKDIMNVPASYAYAGMYISELIYEDLVSLILDAKESGYTLVVEEGYRSFVDQKEIYEEYKSSYSEEYADEIAARAGHSEYQTGLSIEIVPYNKVIEENELENNEEYNWLLNNAYKYGFIMRYPKGKEHITGFSYNPWRYRYVGRIASKIIHDENITFDEYYEYYVK